MFRGFAKIKRRVSLAINALKGAPLIYDYPVPKMIVERQPIKTIQADFEIRCEEVDRVDPEVVWRHAKRKMMENLAAELEQSGMVEFIHQHTDKMITHHAIIRVIPPIEE